MRKEQAYVVPLDYGNRKSEREFIRQLLQRYDTDTLVGCALFVNNNPYNLEALLCLNFRGEHHGFETWLTVEQPKKKRDFRFLFDEIANAVFARGFNVVTFIDDSTLDLVMSGEVNEIFLFPDREEMIKIFGSPVTTGTFSVFLSHSSQDKPIIDSVFETLHRSGIRAWYDRYEIQPGDSITNRINEGLRTSHLGLLFFSKNFLNKKSGWPVSEANFFFQKRMRKEMKNFIVVNIDLNVDELPPLLQDFRFIDIRSSNAHQEIVDAIDAARKARE